MKRSHLFKHPLALLFAALCVLFLSLFLLNPANTSAGPGLEAAWKRARQSGAYHFTADIVQNTIPLPTVTNVGRSSRQDAVHIEGQTNLPARALDFTLWSHGGSVLNAQGGVEVKVEGDRAFARRGAGAWEEINDFTGLFAPEGDFMAYLAAAKDIVNRGSETRAVVPFTRYTFRVDGHSYAVYLRDQLEQHLAEKGELPPGVSLDLPRQYAEMSGTGELWVGGDGLPLRQIIHLEFPERADAHRVEADVTVNFSDFEHSPLSRTPTFILTHLSLSTFRHVALFVNTLALVVILIAYSRSKRLYVATVLVIIASLVSTPLLQSLQAADFAERQAAHTQEQEQRAQESEMTRSLRELQTEDDFNPHAEPLRLAQLTRATRDAQPTFALAALVPDVIAPASDDGADSDSDGLTDHQEELLGLDAYDPDYDDDLITDTLEVEGFEYPVGSGQMWYTDPQEMDTNKDGIGDGREWFLDQDEDGLPDDTDGDGVPDLFDDDNDGDGVPDNLDLSPYTTTRGGSPFNDANPFSLIVDNLTPGKPTYVEFQLRPTNPDHLWYAYNVLDWPDGDRQGQIQDDDGATFADVLDNDSPSDANGDLKLLPMLEIRISGSPDNLPPTSTLESQYGIYVQDFQGDGAEKAAYVPLQLATENDSGARVAFYGKMLYLPSSLPGGTEGGWGDAQQVRLVWAVQALVDECESYSLGDTDGDGEEDFSKECQSYSEHNKVQVIHTYDDEWYLTGLNVRENHDVDVGVIYEDPASDADLNDDGALMKLTYALDHTFLAGRDLDGDSERDITVAELYRRFALTNTATITEHWGITNTLGMTIATYTHQDESLATIAMTTTPAILDEFTSYTPVSPTLLFVREESYRTTNLDAGDADGTFTWDGQQLTVDLDAGGGLPVQTAAAVKWAPYRYRDGEWESYPIEEYWDELGHRYEHDFDDVSDPTEARGRLMYVRIYYLGLYTGLSTVVQSGDVPLSTELAAPELSGDAELARSITGKFVAGARFIINMVVRNLSGDAKLVFTFLGKLDNLFVAETVGDVNPGLFKSLKYLKEEFRQWRLRWQGMGRGMNKMHVAAGVMALVAIGVLIAGVALLIADHFNHSTGLRIAGVVLVGAVLVGLQIMIPMIAVVRMIRSAVQAGQSVVRATTSVLKSSSALIGLTKVANVIGLVLMVGVVWGFFIYQIASGGVGFGSVEFNMLLARAIADTIIAVLMFALSCTIVGAIIVAIFTLIDLLLTFLIDFSMTDWIADKIAKAIYTYKVMVEPEIDSGGLNMQLVHPELGMVEGNQLAVTMALTTTVTHKNPHDPRVIPYLWKYTDGNIRSTTFKHVMASTAYSVTVSKNEMKNDWTVSSDHRYWGHNMRRAENMVSLTQVITLTTGVNATLPLYINTGYSLPGLSCWMVPLPPFWYPIPICYGQTIGGDSSTDIGESIVLDVLPDTLDEFYTLTWGDFAVQRDHDGDGLLSAATGGNDPDDRTWDTDGDGLSDTYELTRRSMSDPGGGVRPSTLNKDTDGDGLCDADEIRWGTLPQRRDSDGDGMNDGEEVFHRHCITGEWIGGWTFEYGVITDTYGITHTLTTRVTSDPTNANTDGDALDDLAERTLAENPCAWTPSPVVLRTEIDDDDGIVAPGVTFAFTATAENQIEHDPPLFFLGGVTVTLPAPLGSGVATDTFNIYKDESSALALDLTVGGGASSGEALIHTEMAGDMHDGDLHTYWKWDDPQPDQVSVSTAQDFGYARIVPALNLANGLYASASTEGRQTVNLRHAEAVFSGETEVRSDTRCGRGVGAFPPGVACNDDGKCLTVWGNTHDDPCTWVYFDEFYCNDDSDVGGTAEFLIKFNGDKVGHWGDVDQGDWRTINKIRSYCNSGKIKVWETDASPNPDDYMGSHTIGYCGASGKHHFEDDAEVTLYYDIHATQWDGIYGRIINSNRTAQGGQLSISDQGPEYRYRRYPAAASDGADFLSVWQEKRGDWDIYARKVFSDGNGGSIIALASTTTDEINPAVAWVGDKYMVVWEQPSSGGDPDIMTAYVNAGGQYIADSRRLLVSTDAHETRPHIAYNSHTGQALVLYAKNILDVVGRLVDVPSGAVSDEFYIGSAWDQVGSLAVVYEPLYDHWLVSWDESDHHGNKIVNYVPLSAEGEVLQDKQGLGPGATHADLYASLTFPSLNNHDIACSRQSEVDPDIDYAQCAIVAANNDNVFLQPLYYEDISPFLGGIKVATDTLVLVDADAPTSTITSLSSGQYLNVTGTLIIGGDAGDPGVTASGIAKVEISLDGGATWTDTVGAESWAYAWDVPDTDGAATLLTRATDLVGNVGSPTALTVHLDRTPPSVAITDSGIVGSTRNAEEHWQVPLGGTVSDGGSGVQSVEALLAPDGSRWQTATLNLGNWDMDYVLPEFGADGRSLTDPTGRYTILARASDAVGNQAEPVTRTLRVDATPPEADLTDTGPSTTTITTTLTIGGVITDPGSVAAGVQALEVSFTPAGEDPSDWQAVALAQSGAGVITSTWTHPVPAEVEGVYEIDLRGTDVLGNRNDDTSTWQAWQGEIDNFVPRAALTITYRGAGHAAQTVYEGRAEDFNLTEDGFQFPCPLQAADRVYYDDAWWSDVTSDTQRLYRLTPACIVNGFQSIPPYLRACDSHDHCTVVTATLPSGHIPPARASTILTPAHESVLSTTLPISITGGAYALHALRALTVTVNGTPFYTQAWHSPTDTLWAATWTPPGEGRYTFLSQIEDSLGNVQTGAQPISITVDTQLPAITIASTVLTTAHRLSYGRVPLTGVATDSVGLEAVEVAIDGGDWDEASFNGETWRYPWYLDDEPDGATYTVTARAVDGAEHTARVTKTVTVDLTPPEPVTVTLAYTDTLGVRHPLTSGQTIRESPVDLIAEWTASSSGDLSRYYVGWPVSQTVELAALTAYAPADSRHHAATVGEPQARYAHVVSIDAHGNRQVQTLGPVYVDTPSTPDYILLPSPPGGGAGGGDIYHGWMESGCSQIGADREVERNAYTGASLHDVQKMYLSWDSDALRLTWTGANWNAAGDLFIYLDTGAGGATTAYDPYGSGPTITLPAQGGAQLAANYLIQVENEHSASLRQWTGSSWGNSTALDASHYQLDLDAQPAHTDLLIPWAWLGSPASLKLVALASDEDALRIWAAMPDKNPLSSERVINPVASGYITLPFALTQQYTWTALGSGLCPNQGQFADADLRVYLAADPPGVEVGFLEHDLPGLLTPGQPLDGDLDGSLDMALPVDSQPTLMGNGQSITYTLTYTNVGAVIAPGATVTLTARGGVELAGGSPQVLALTGDGGAIHIAATVNAALDGQSAEVDAVVADDTHGAFDWLWVQHDVDTVPPENLEIEAPVAYISAYTNTVRGSVSDPSGVPLIELETQPGGIRACPDATPNDGQWVCVWNAGGAADGTQFQMRVRATDRFGNMSVWSDWRTVTVDATPPTVSLSADTETALGDGLLATDELGLTGQVHDERQADKVKICVAPPGETQPDCSLFDVLSSNSTADWYARAPLSGDEDGAWRTFSFYGLDSVGNCSPVPVTRTVQVDVVAPVVTTTTRANGAVLGVPTTAFAGEVRDGYGVDRVDVRMIHPDDHATWHTAARSGADWDYTTTFTTAGEYILSVEGWDRAGNLRQEGPFHLTVYEGTLVSDLALAHSASSEPAITGDPLTYTLSVANQGPSTATAVTLTATLSSVVTLLSITPDQGSCSEAGGVITCTLGSLDKGNDAVVNVQVHVPLTTTGKLVSTASVESNKIDFNKEDNQRTLYISTFQPLSELAIVTDAPTPLGYATAFTATLATGSDVAYVWTFGDGMTATGKVAAHTYLDVGRYTAVVTASNSVNTLTATLLIPVDIPVTTPLLEEGFEDVDLPSGWLRTLLASVGDDGGWRMSDERIHSGTQAAFHNDVFGGYDSWLVTSQVTPTVGSELAFWQNQNYASNYEKHSLWVSCGSQDPKDGDFVQLTELGPGTEDTWEEVRLALDAYVGQPVYLAFRYEGDFADEWYVDDVRVTAPLVATNDSPTSLGQTTTLTASLATGSNVVYTWDLGDETTDSGAVVTHSYPAPGAYTAVITASNSVNAVTATTTVRVGVAIYLPLALRNYTPPCYDSYEPDDSVAQAKAITTDGAPQQHNFHQAGDVDWVTFEVPDASKDYVIETFDLADADTVIYLYDSDGERLLDWNDDAGPGTHASRLLFNPYHAGAFYVKIVQYDPTAGGCATGYSVRVTVQP